MAKQRNHNEWFRAVSLGNRKSCPRCGEKLNGELIWSWGQYIDAKWRTVSHFCRQCFPKFQRELIQHAGQCGCTITLVGYGGTRLPTWLTLEKPKDAEAPAVAAAGRIEQDQPAPEATPIGA